jgi:hypothetical protein
MKFPMLEQEKGDRLYNKNKNKDSYLCAHFWNELSVMFIVLI